MATLPLLVRDQLWQPGNVIFARTYYAVFGERTSDPDLGLTYALTAWAKARRTVGVTWNEISGRITEHNPLRRVSSASGSFSVSNVGSPVSAITTIPGVATKILESMSEKWHPSSGITIISSAVRSLD